MKQLEEKNELAYSWGAVGSRPDNEIALVASREGELKFCGILSCEEALQLADELYAWADELRAT